MARMKQARRQTAYKTTKKNLHRKSTKREIRKRKQTFFVGCSFLVSQRNFIDMLNKAPRLKSTIKTKAKGNINVRPASEAMVGYRFVRS